MLSKVVVSTPQGQPIYYYTNSLYTLLLAQDLNYKNTRRIAKLLFCWKLYQVLFHSCQEWFCMRNKHYTYFDYFSKKESCNAVIIIIITIIGNKLGLLIIIDHLDYFEQIQNVRYWIHTLQKPKIKFNFDVSLSFYMFLSLILISLFYDSTDSTLIPFVKAVVAASAVYTEFITVWKVFLLATTSLCNSSHLFLFFRVIRSIWSSRCCSHPSFPMPFSSPYLIYH